MKIFQEQSKIEPDIFQLFLTGSTVPQGLLRFRNQVKPSATIVSIRQPHIKYAQVIKYTMSYLDEGLNPRPDELHSSGQQPFLIIYNYRQIMVSRRRKELRNTLKQRKRAVNTDHNKQHSSAQGQEQKECVAYAQEKLWDVFCNQELSKHELHHCATESVVKVPEMKGCGIKQKNQVSLFAETQGSIQKKKLFLQAFCTFSYSIDS